MPYMPVPELNVEEWDQLEPASALDAVIELVLHEDYNGLHSDKRVKEGLGLHGTAVAVCGVDVRSKVQPAVLIAEQVQTYPNRRIFLSKSCCFPVANVILGATSDRFGLTGCFSHQKLRPSLSAFHCI